MPEPPAAAAGEMEFAALVRRHQAMVFSIAWRFLRDRALAEEVAQEVFLSLHQHLASLESPEHALFWLRKVASNAALDAARRRRRRPVVSLADAPEPVAAANTASDPLRDEAIRKMIAALPERSRIVVILRYQEDLDPAEIAAVLGVPVGTVKSQLQRALALLREKLQRKKV